jgi:cystathionine gamma-synthase
LLLCHRHGLRLFRRLSNVDSDVVEIDFESTLVTPIGDGGSGDDLDGEVSDKEGYTGPMEAKDPTDSHGGGVGSIESWLVSAGRDRKAGSPLNTPPWPASNFVLGGQRAYSRDDGTPGWDALEEIVGGLEGGSSVAFASGMAGIAAVFEQLPAGAKVALADDCYQGVAGLANAGQQRGRWSVRRIAVGDTAAWIQAGRDSDLMWLESPSNPLLVVAELEQICAASRKPGAILGVDNTFATPLNQRPLALGADVSVQSVTKFIGGHSDLLGGVVTVRDSALLARLRQARELAGATPGTLETFLAVRGARTLAVRLERAQRNAMVLADRLAAHPQVLITRYPGLASHPTHDAARRQLKGFGTIISFDVQGGAAAADAVCAMLGLIQHATSLGAVESTIERRASVPGQEHLPPSLLRLSVGIEAVEDLWADLDRALRSAAAL